MQARGQPCETLARTNADEMSPTSPTGIENRREQRGGPYGDARERKVMAGEAREGGSAADMTRSADYRRGYMDALEDVADTYRVAIVALPTSRWLRRSPDALTVCLRLYEAVREVRRRAARKPKPGRNA